MIRSRLKRMQFFLTLAIFSTPLIAFSIAGYIRFGTRLLPRYSSDADPFPYFGLLLLTTAVWAISSEHYNMTLIDFSLRTGSALQRAALACLSTGACVLSAIFFYREATFSRIFVWISAL